MPSLKVDKYQIGIGALVFPDSRPFQVSHDYFGNLPNSFHVKQSFALHRLPVRKTVQGKKSVNREKVSNDAEFPSEIVTPEFISVDMQKMVKTAAGDRSWQDGVKTGIARAARFYDLSFNQAKRAWYREWANPPAAIYLKVKKRYDDLCEREAKALRQSIEFTGTRIADARERLDHNAAVLDLAGEDLLGEG